MGEGLKVEQILAYYDEIGFKRLDARGDRRAGAQGAASRVRDVEPGHPRALGVTCADCHMPYERVARSRSATTRCAARAEHQPRLPDVPQVAARRSCRRASRRSRTARSSCATWPMDALVGADRRPQGGARPRAQTMRTLARRARHAAPRAVPAGLRRGGELDGLPRAAGGGPAARDSIDYARQGQLALLRARRASETGDAASASLPPARTPAAGPLRRRPARGSDAGIAAPPASRSRRCGCSCCARPG